MMMSERERQKRTKKRKCKRQRGNAKPLRGNKNKTAKQTVCCIAQFLRGTCRLARRECPMTGALKPPPCCCCCICISSARLECCWNA